MTVFSTTPAVPDEFLPTHIALVMDGNGRWAQERGLPRTEGHKRGEAVLLSIVDACLELGIPYLSAYAFSTENWRRSVGEVRFLMGFNRDVLRRQRDGLHDKGVRIRWVGRRPRLWRSVIRELETAEELTKDNTAMTLAMCVNYGGRAEIVDAARSIAALAAEGKLRPEDINEKNFADFLPMLTCSCAPPAKNAPPTSCSGNRPMPKWCTRTNSFPTSPPTTSTPQCWNTRGATADSAG